MAAQQQQPIAPSVSLPHAWSGSEKAYDVLRQEQKAFIDSLSNDELRHRIKGEHFARMEDVWSNVACQVVVEDFSNIKRTRSQGALYASCYKYIANEIRDPDYTSGSANQRGNQQRLDPLGNLGGEAAHLFSHAKVCHRAYPFLAEAAIGISIGELNLEGEVHVNRRKLLVGVNGGYHFTSLKSHKFNKMYWKNQKEFFDSDDPSVLVVPLLLMNQIKDWTTDETHAVDYDIAVFTFGPTGDVVASETLRYAKGTCTPLEVELARENLTYFVKGIAAHLLSNNVFESFTENHFVAQNSSLLRWQSLVKYLREQVTPEILIPSTIGNVTTIPNARIAKARMSTGTSLPDPWLLLAKSAINYSASNGQKLMPACSLPDESDSEDDEYDDYGISNQSKDIHEKLSPVQTEYYLGALHRSGFGCDESDSNGMQAA